MQRRPMRPRGHGDSFEEILLDTALWALAEQEAALRDLRARAGTLLAASALTVSFLGTQTLDRDGLSVIAWLAIGAFLVSLLAAVHVLVPESNASFSLDSSRLRPMLSPLQGDPASMIQQLGRSVSHRRTANQPLLDRLSISYRLGALALLAQAALWIAGLSPIV